MRVNKHVATFLTFLPSVMLFLPSAEGTEGTRKTPDSRHMRCVLKIAADAAVVPLNFTVIESLLRSDAVAGRAARTVLGAEFAEIPHVVNIGLLATDQGDQREGEAFAPADPNVIEVPIRGGERTMLLSLAIDLPGEMKPVAPKLGTALVENLRRELDGAFNAQVEWLKLGLNLARAERSTAHAALSDAVKETMPADTVGIRLDPADEAVYKQLDAVVDLSALNVGMVFKEAVGIVRRSVNPPLKIVVLWRELSDNADIQPDTPINMDSLTNVKLGAGLTGLLGALSNPQLTITLDYAVNDGVITIGTKESLPKGKMEMRVHELPALLRAGARADGLASLIQQTIEPDSWFELSESGEGTVLPSGDAKLIVWQTPGVHKKIAELLQTMAAKFPITTPVDAPREVLGQQIQSLVAYRNTIEEEIDKLQERQGALAREKNDSERKAMVNALSMTTSELYRTIGQLQAVRTRILGGNRDSPEADAINNVIDRIKQCADGCLQSTVHSDGGLDSPANMTWPSLTLLQGLTMDEAQTLSRRLLAKQSELERVSRRIAGVQDALVGQTRFDPEVHRLRLAAKRLEEADLRVHRLESQIAELQPCTVTILGDSD